jgi:hypothetical protein
MDWSKHFSIKKWNLFHGRKWKSFCWQPIGKRIAGSVCALLWVRLALFKLLKLTKEPKLHRINTGRVKKTGEKCSTKAAFLCRLHPLCPMNYEYCKWLSRSRTLEEPCLTMVIRKEGILNFYIFLNSFLMPSSDSKIDKKKLRSCLTLNKNIISRLSGAMVNLVPKNATNQHVQLHQCVLTVFW